jgi:hypothetical protein
LGALQVVGSVAAKLVTAELVARAERRMRTADSNQQATEAAARGGIMASAGIWSETDGIN